MRKLKSKPNYRRRVGQKLLPESRLGSHNTPRLTAQNLISLSTRLLCSVIELISKTAGSLPGQSTFA